MNVSVVLASETPDDQLPALLSALRYQTHPAFEVVLVTGTRGVDIASFAGRIKVVECHPWNPARVRNVGAAHAAGEVVAFLDPFAIPDVLWLKELVQGYTAQHAAAVGGPIAHTDDGDPCYTADRLGNRLDAVSPPYGAFQIPYADRYVCLHAGNSSFRRSPFLEVGGFDEEIGAELYQADLCMRLTDRGNLLQPSPRAVVYKINDQFRVQAEYQVIEGVRNKVRFAVRSANPLTARADVLRHFETNTPEDDLDRAVWEGIALAVQDRQPAALAATPASPFLPFPSLETAGRKLTLCFTANQVPPTSSDPEGRHTWDRAHGLAERGHEIHVFAIGVGAERTDFEQGVWVHRVAAGPAEGVAVHRAITQLAHTRPLDLILARGCAGVYCVLDRALNCVITLEPTLKIQLEDYPAAQRTPELDQTLYLEQLLLQSACQVIAPGPGLLRRVRRHHAAPFAPTTIHFCPPTVRDRAGAFSPRRSSSAVRVLFVGPLDNEHGADLFLQAAATLIREGHDLEAVLTGDGDEPSESGPSYRTLVERASAALPEFRRRVLFAGEWSEDDLSQAYADCDVVCLPYRVDAAAVPCLEAMTFGKPVVASDLISNREILGDDSLFRRGDANALADRLREWIADGELRRHLGRQARQAYENRFAFDRVLETTLDAYRQCVEAVASPPRGDAR